MKAAEHTKLKQPFGLTVPPRSSEPSVPDPVPHEPSITSRALLACSVPSVLTLLM